MFFEILQERCPPDSAVSSCLRRAHKVGRMVIVMKQKIFGVVALIISLQMMVTSSFAVSIQNDISTTSTEIQNELVAAEDILGGPCKLESEETRIVGNYVVENRLYVLDNPVNRASGKVGGVSSQVWRPVYESTWNIKVYLIALFYYNGTTAICIPEESEAWAVNNLHEELDVDLNAQYTHKDGSTAKASCRYAITLGQVPTISATLSVTCSKTGQVGIVSEEEHTYL